MIKKYSGVLESKDEFLQNTDAIIVNGDSEFNNLNYHNKSEREADFLGEEKYHEESVKISSN